jgi:ATP-dependent Lhr-like helicase
LKKPDKPTPFAFPIMVDGLSRHKLTNEGIADRVRKMIEKATK